QQSQQDLNLKEVKQSASASLDAFGSKRDAEREEHFDASVPLELQALGEAHTAGSRPLIVSPESAPHHSLKPSQRSISPDA
ncbi:hypothetical protein ABTN20_20600, partial [Acinetobacter baumannii]